MSRALLYHLILTIMGLAIIAIGASASGAGHPSISGVGVFGWYIMGASAGMFFCVRCHRCREWLLSAV